MDSVSHVLNPFFDLHRDSPIASTGFLRSQLDSGLGRFCRAGMCRVERRLGSSQPPLVRPGEHFSSLGLQIVPSFRDCGAGISPRLLCGALGVRRESYLTHLLLWGVLEDRQAVGLASVQSRLPCVFLFSRPVSGAEKGVCSFLIKI